MSEWAATNIFRSWLAADDFGASVGREVHSFALFSIVVTDIVRVLLFDLYIALIFSLNDKPLTRVRSKVPFQ